MGLWLYSKRKIKLLLKKLCMPAEGINAKTETMILMIKIPSINPTSEPKNRFNLPIILIFFAIRLNTFFKSLIKIFKSINSTKPEIKEQSSPATVEPAIMPSVVPASKVTPAYFFITSVAIRAGIAPVESSALTS